MVQLSVRNHLTYVGDDDLPIVMVGALLFHVMMAPLLLSALVTYHEHGGVAKTMLDLFDGYHSRVLLLFQQIASQTVLLLVAGVVRRLP